jgi:hypothetical protein
MLPPKLVALRLLHEAMRYSHDDPIAINVNTRKTNSSNWHRHRHATILIPAKIYPRRPSLIENHRRCYLHASGSLLSSQAASLSSLPLPFVLLKFPLLSVVLLFPLKLPLLPLPLKLPLLLLPLPFPLKLPLLPLPLPLPFPLPPPGRRKSKENGHRSNKATAAGIPARALKIFISISSSGNQDKEHIIKAGRTHLLPCSRNSRHCLQLTKLTAAPQGGRCSWRCAVI